MKKKGLVLTMLIACITLLLTACSEGGRDYSGSCEIIYKVGAEYENVVVSCASADISKVDETTYKVSLESTAPVEVILSATGYANKVYRYSSSQLKKGSITETVTFDAITFVYKVKINTFDKASVEPIVKTDGIEIRKTQTAGEYELTSRTPINSDVVISAEGYYDYTIFGNTIKYAMGTYGAMDSAITLMRKGENKVLVTTNLSVKKQVIVIRASDFMTVAALRIDNILALDVADYYFEVDNNLEFVSKNDLANGYYYYNFNKTQIAVSNIEEFDINNVEINGEEMKVDRQYSFVYHRKPLEVGQLIKIHTYHQGYEKTYIGNVTEEMVENGKIDLVDLDVVTNGWKYNEIEFDIRFISPNGVVDMASGVVYVNNSWNGNREYGVNDKINYNHRNNDSDIRIENLVDKQGKKYTPNYVFIEERVREQSNVKGNSLTVDIFVKPQVEFTIKYVDYRTGETVLEQVEHEQANVRIELDLINYKAIDFESIIVGEALQGKTITVQVAKTYNVTIKTEGSLDIDGRMFSTEEKGGDQIVFYDNKASLTIDERLIGKTLYYKYDGIQKSYYFFLDIPDEIENGQTIMVNVQEQKDEWA